MLRSNLSVSVIFHISYVQWATMKDTLLAAETTAGDTVGDLHLGTPTALAEGECSAAGQAVEEVTAEAVPTRGAAPDPEVSYQVFVLNLELCALGVKCHPRNRCFGGREFILETSH